MVAKITILKRLLDAINYNEKKVEKGKAECIYSGNYLLDAKEMNFYDKLSRLKSLDELNTRATTKTLHASLNFDPSENLNNQTLSQIAVAYMEKIGFGEQPFLVYNHEDAGHPHIHIVSTAIQYDGSRINTHNIGKNQSEKARKDIEESFGLIKASSKKASLEAAITAVDLKKITYGQTETKKALGNVVNTVFRNYAFTSLPEYNAALRQFNVFADQGREISRIRKTGGLVYRIIDGTGKSIGVPIKASLLTGKPTLKNLELKFETNTLRKDQHKKAIKQCIDECMIAKPQNLQRLIEQLKQKQVYVVLRQNADGRVYGITFVDNKSKCVFNGSDIGKEYSIASLQRKLIYPVNHCNSSHTGLPKEHKETNEQKQPQQKSLIEELINPKQEADGIPFQFRKKRKKKKND